MKDEQDLLQAMVEAWNPNPQPEYRGFRCAYCQKYINEAHYHWLDSDLYYLPVHLCEDCEKLLKSGELEVNTEKRRRPDLRKFRGNYNKVAETTFEQLVNFWRPGSQGELSLFYCDKCSLPLRVDKTDGRRKGYHVWWKYNERLCELHFDKEHGVELELQS